MTSDYSPSGKALRHLDTRYHEANDGLNDFMKRQVNGENTDPAEFMALVEKRMMTHQAMQSQLKLNEKPLKTALSDAK